MKTSETEEAVKVVAEVMGGNYQRGYYTTGKGFTETIGTHNEYYNFPDKGRHSLSQVVKIYLSLDALVSVWEKLGFFTEFEFDLCKELNDERRWSFVLTDPTGLIGAEASGKTIQEAALLATAEAIDMLRNERTENTEELE